MSISDIHLKFKEDGAKGLVFDFEGSLVFPGPRIPNAQDRPLIASLVERVRNATRDSFWITISDPLEAVFRVEKNINAVDGIWFRLRKTMQERPYLDTLPAPISQHIREQVLSPHLTSGGLILICGAPGVGKTTTASAILASRLKKYGGMAWTVEDPPEILSLNGWHGEGYCTQTEAFAGSDGWEQSIRVLLRSQPVSSKLMLFVGEIRTKLAAQMIIRAASNGFLVLTTSFATDLINGIEAFAKMAGDEHNDMFASVMRGCLYQKLIQKPRLILQTQYLQSESSTSRVAQLIRGGQFRQLKDEIAFQQQGDS